ncbi:MAG: outer membrane beta-barrel protein [Chloroflexia bacterium]|nr:outer membrane beta-barrel protein [Chloroflexia bacterium]
MEFYNQYGEKFFSIEGYYRVTHNHTEYVRTVYSETAILRYPENVGQAYAAGAEAMLSYELFNTWQFNLSGNVYNYKVEGNLFDKDYSSESLNWNARLNNSFNITKNFQLQINGAYNSPTATSQGTTEGYFSVDGAIKTNFLERKLSMVLQLRDILQTAKHEQTTIGESFYYYNKSYRKAPFVMLSLSYKFNNYKSNEKQGGRGEMGGDDEF